MESIQWTIDAAKLGPTNENEWRIMNASEKNYTSPPAPIYLCLMGLEINEEMKKESD